MGILLAVSAGMAGCAVDQQKEVDQYRQLLDRDVPTIEFNAGEPLSLQEALVLANHHNETLGVAGEDYLRALIEKDRAAGFFMPTISLVPSYSITEKLSRDHDNRSFDVPVNARANVFNGFSDLARFRAAGRNIEQQRALLLDAQAAVLLDVAETYYQVLRSEQLLDVLRNTLNVQDERLRDTRARQKAGLARPLDVAQTEAQAASTRALVIRAQNDIQNARSLLALLVGAQVHDSPLVDEAQVPEEVLAIESLMDDAMRQRYDLRAAESAIAVARQFVDAAIGQYYPSVALNLNVFLSRESVPTESDWNGLLAINLPIFSANQIEADVRAAWSEFRRAKLEESFTRRQVMQQVEVAWQNLQGSRARIRELTVQVTAATEALRQAEQSYRAGLATNLDRLTAQDEVLSAQLQITSERYNQKVAWMNLLRATGALSTRLPGDPAPPATRPATVPATQPAS